MYSNIKRFYVNQSLKLNNRLNIVGKQQHYLKNVIRLKQKDIIRLFNGKDGEWLAKIIKIQKKNIEVNIEKKILNQNNGSDLWLFFCPIKMQRLNILVQKSTELGVSKIIPIRSSRSNIKNLNINNLQQNSISASEQSGRLNIPIIEKIIELKYLNSSLLENRCLIYCDEQKSDVRNLINIMNKVNKKFIKWALLVGPEGGFTSREREQLLKLKNTYPVTLGKRILRSDTAAIAALFSIQQFIEV